MLNKNNRHKQQGFTLIELLLVVVIIGILLAVIVPRAWRANVDSKYGLVRQNATELASFASQWAEQMMEAQDLNAAPRLIAYYNSLTTASAVGDNAINPSIEWIANATNSNWRNKEDDGSDVSRVNITNRTIGNNPEEAPEAAVEDLVPPERLQRNPFSGSSVFRDLPSTNPIPGALACGNAADGSGAGGDWAYFALVFQGTDSTGDTPNDAGLHAGMAEDLGGLRNGIFMARMQPQ